MHNDFRVLEIHIMLLVKYNEKQYRALKCRAFLRFVGEQELVQILSQVTCLLLNYMTRACSF